jgi:hypothetical protein
MPGPATGMTLIDIERLGGAHHANFVASETFHAGK